LVSSYLNYTLIDRNSYYYYYSPCFDNYTDLTNVTSTRLPLCNQTTTKVVVTVNQYLVNNVVNSVTAAVNQANLIHGDFILCGFIYVFIWLYGRGF
jgi:hypothetical protein